MYGSTCQSQAVSFFMGTEGDQSSFQVRGGESSCFLQNDYYGGCETELTTQNPCSAVDAIYLVIAVVCRATGTRLTTHVPKLRFTT